MSLIFAFVGLQDVNGFVALFACVSTLATPKMAGVMYPMSPHLGSQGLNGFVQIFGLVCTSETPKMAAVI